MCHFSGQSSHSSIHPWYTRKWLPLWSPWAPSFNLTVEDWSENIRNKALTQVALLFLNYSKSSKMALKSLEAAGLIYLACTVQLHVFFCVIFSLHPFPYPQLFSSLTLFVERSVCTSILWFCHLFILSIIRRGFATRTVFSVQLRWEVLRTNKQVTTKHTEIKETTHYLLLWLKIKKQ